MGLVNWFRTILSVPDATPADERALSGSSESALGASLDNLPKGQRGWIPLGDAARLFSTEEGPYAFGEFDDAGKKRLADFAAAHRCTPDFRPIEGRLYFRKNA